MSNYKYFKYEIYSFSDCTAPFAVSVVTDATADAIQAAIDGTTKGNLY